MSADSKRIKIVALITLVYGIVAAVLGVVLLVARGAAAAYGPAIASGAVSLYYGAQGALIANVPNTIKKLVTLSVVVLVVQLALAALVYFLAGTAEVLALCVVCVAFVLAFVQLILSRGLNKKNLAK